MDDQDKQDTNNQRVVSLLKQYSNGGLSFEEAKEKLISQGYTEAAINIATDDYQYGSKQISDIPNKVTDYFQTHPGEGVVDGTNLLKAQHKEDLADQRNQAILDAAAASAAGKLGVGNLDAQVEYESKFSFDVGISFWLLIVIGIGVNVIAYFIVTKLRISQWFYTVNSALSLIVVVLLIKRMK